MVDQQYPGIRPAALSRDRPDNTQSVVGSEGDPIKTDEGVMVSQMRGSEGEPIETASGRMIAQMIGSEGQAIETASGRMIAQMIGSEGQAIETAAGRMIAQIVGSDGVVSQGPDGRLEAGIFGSGGEEFSQTVTGSLRNNTYRSGDAFDTSDYPFTIDPAETIYELTVFSTPTQQTLDVTTAGGDTLTGLNPRASNFVISSLEIDTVTFNDDGNSENTSGFWAGESA